MFYEFTHRHTPCTVHVDGDEFCGADEKVILSREKRATSIIDQEYAFSGRFAPDSVVIPGALVKTADDDFFVISMRPTPSGDRNCFMYKTNAKVEIQRATQSFDENDNPIVEQFNAVQDDVLGYVQYVSAQLRKEDMGLLPSTTYVLFLHPSADIKRLDRVMLKGRPYQVDVVDDVKLPNTLYVQLSEDMR